MRAQARPQVGNRILSYSKTTVAKGGYRIWGKRSASGTRPIQWGGVPVAVNQTPFSIRFGIYCASRPQKRCRIGQGTGDLEEALATGAVQ